MVFLYRVGYTLPYIKIDFNYGLYNNEKAHLLIYIEIIFKILVIKLNM